MQSNSLGNEGGNSLQERVLYIAFVLAVVAAFIPTLLISEAPLTSPAMLMTLLGGVIYILVGVLVFDRVSSRPALIPKLIYFLIQIVIASAVLFIAPSTGALWVMSLPLVSQAIVELPRSWAVLISLLILVTFTVLVGIMLGWGVALGSLGGYASGIFFVAVFTEVFASERRSREQIQQLAANLEAANQQLRAYAAQVEELAVVRERNRLAREIHDSLGHYLTVVNMQLEAAQAIFDLDREAARQGMEKAQTLTKEGLTEIRRSVAALQASPLQGQPLTKAIQHLLEETRSAGIQGSLQVEGEPTEQAPELEHTLFRAVQEGLTNVRKHARASSVAVELTYAQPGLVRLVIEDNGVGAESDTLKEGLGLLGLKERVRLVGGKLSWTSTARKGFRLSVEVPAG